MVEFGGATLWSLFSLYITVTSIEMEAVIMELPKGQRAA